MEEVGCLRLVTSLSFSTTGGGIRGPSYETPLRVVIALASFLGFGMVLLGKELELEGGFVWVVLDKLDLTVLIKVCSLGFVLKFRFGTLYKRVLVGLEHLLIETRGFIWTCHIGGWFLWRKLPTVQFVEIVDVIMKNRRSFPLRVNGQRSSLIVIYPRVKAGFCCISNRIISIVLVAFRENHGEDIVDGSPLKRSHASLKASLKASFGFWSSQVRIDLGGSLSNQSRASPSREKGKSKSFIEVFELRDVKR
ncbi:hypothetical protein Tco_1112771 [Tanacetum coccineum]|uniref:Uncharacterized protein n=1 Tax=Tanacetum coccineum TaxID=301880 RepID=A0ABQ5ITA5_9ASTR